jgi:protein-L-isoaspartate(D-aspartate) O-methyltransferase
VRRVQGDGERAEERARMVSEQIAARGVRDERVLAALRTVPRHRFVPESVRAGAYEDHPLPIGSLQTISQPYIVAVMSELAQLQPGERVLEVGTGCGYQAAVLAELGAEVHSIEILPELATSARETLRALGYERVNVVTGDGYRLVAAAPDHVPQPLLEQLAVGGRLVIPVGSEFQQLRVLERTACGIEDLSVFDVRFVPMTGEAQRRCRPECGQRRSTRASTQRIQSPSPAPARTSPSVIPIEFAPRSPMSATRPRAVAYCAASSATPNRKSATPSGK